MSGYRVRGYMSLSGGILSVNRLVSGVCQGVIKPDKERKKLKLLELS